MFFILCAHSDLRCLLIPQTTVTMAKFRGWMAEYQNFKSRAKSKQKTKSIIIGWKEYAIAFSFITFLWWGNILYLVKITIIQIELGMTPLLSRKEDYEVCNKNYYIVRNAGCTCSRHTLKLSLIFLKSINESMNELTEYI